MQEHFRVAQALQQPSPWDTNSLAEAGAKLLQYVGIGAWSSSAHCAAQIDSADMFSIAIHSFTKVESLPINSSVQLVASHS